MVDDILVSWAGLCEGIKVVHVVHVPPQVLHLLWDVKVREVLTCQLVIL